MPHIIVVADSERNPAEDAVMLRERISASDLESQHFGAQLLERLEWAVGDAHQAEQNLPHPMRPATQPATAATGETSLEPQRSASVVTTAS